MKNDNDAFKELQHSLERIKGNLHVLETNISVEKQMEYFRFSEELKNKAVKSNIEEQIEILKSPTSSFVEIKYALAYLAVSADVKAYRAIESYNENHQDDWVTMSLLHAKITLESEFSDEKQVFISTGLGGKDDLLRFFAFFKSNRLKNFSQYQQDLIAKEIPYYIQKYGGITENLQIANNYFSLLFLVTISIDIKVMLEQAIFECNQYGNFIDNGFIVTNVKVFSEEDIQRELQKSKFW
ncbi:MAG: hypothetical protein LBT25_02540 [Candidatus Symbiothrix sp.]|jgi:hypothetical protein|nr:hypothetical protein [Candidatus Symbiothrix sp.]